MVQRSTPTWRTRPLSRIKAYWVPISPRAFLPLQCRVTRDSCPGLLPCPIVPLLILANDLLSSPCHTHLRLMAHLLTVVSSILHSLNVAHTTLRLSFRDHAHLCLLDHPPLWDLSNPCHRYFPSLPSRRYGFPTRLSAFPSTSPRGPSLARRGESSSSRSPHTRRPPCWGMW